MIRCWLHTEPAEDFEEWNLQLSQARWMEQRFFEGLVRAIHGKEG